MAPRPKPLVRYLSLEGDVIAQVNKVLGAAVRDLDKDIARLQGSSKIGDQITLLQARQTRLALKRQTATVFSNIEDVMARGKRSAASLASKMVSDEESPLLKLVMSGKAMQQLADDEALRAASTVETVMARFSSSYKPLSQRVYNSDQLTKGYVDSMVNIQLAKGASWGDFSKAARSMIDPNTPGGVAYAAKRLARTEINNAFHASSAERYRNSNVPGLMVVWNLSGSHKVPDECNKYDEEGPYAPEAVPEKPHPQCLCYLTAELPDEDEFLDLLFGSKGPAIDDSILSPEFSGDTVDRATVDISVEDQSVWSLYQNGVVGLVANSSLRSGLTTRAQFIEKWGEGLGSSGFDNMKTLRRTINAQKPLETAIRTYRGLIKEQVSEFDIKVGSIVQDLGFGSTSLNKEPALLFARNSGVPTVFEILIPSGNKVGALNRLRGYKAKAIEDQGEILLQAGSSFEIKDIKIIDGIRIVQVLLQS